MHGKPSVYNLWRITEGWRHRLLTASLLSVVAACANITLPLVLNRVFDRVVHSESVRGYIICLASLVLVVGLLNAIEAYIVLSSAEGIIQKIRKDTVKRLMELELSEYEKRPTGDLISRVTTDTSALRAGFTSGAVESLGNIVIVVGCCVAMAYLSLPLTGISILILTVSLITMGFLSKGMRDITLEMQDSLGTVANRLLRILEAIRTVRAAGAIDAERARVDSSIDTTFELGKRLSRKEAVIIPVSTSVLQMALLVLLGAGGLLVGAGSLEASTLVTFLLYMMMLFMPVASIGPTLTNVFRAVGAYERLANIQSMQHEVSATTKSRVMVDHTSVNADAAICLREISFSYELVDKDTKEASLDTAWALKDINLDIYSNKVTAIIGPSGAGKSTLFSLLECFYTAQLGEICINGKSIGLMTPEVVRDHFAYVEQNAPLLSGTIKDNLCLGLSDVPLTRCANALEIVGLDHLITNLDHDIDRYIGERGVFLSGGERQRLALARALLSNKDILLLDESTSNIDEMSQNRLISFLHGYAEQKTILMIAHRPALIEAADYVVVLDKGHVVDTGCLEAVRGRCALYQELTRTDSSLQQVGVISNHSKEEGIEG